MDKQLNRKLHPHYSSTLFMLLIYENNHNAINSKIILVPRVLVVVLGALYVTQGGKNTPFINSF